MKRPNVISNFLVFSFLLFSVSAASFAQGSYYNLKPVKTTRTSASKDLQRLGSCWANAGSSFLEAEMMKTGKFSEIDLSELNFVRNAYLEKSGAFLESKGEIKVKETGSAYDVIRLMNKYGMVPESGFNKTQKNAMDNETMEMDAIVGGTLMMVKDKENGVFSEKWQNIYNAALKEYIGEPKSKFSFADVDYDQKSFAEKSGLKTGDYILVSSDMTAEMNQLFVVPMKNNWGSDKAYNVSPDELAIIVKNAVDKGYAVIWYGDINQKSVFQSENIALVPTTGMPGEKSSDTTKITKDPVAEKTVVAADRQGIMKASLSKDMEYRLIYGLSKDKKETEYFVTKDICQQGDKVLNMSQPFVKLNTVYLMLNKNGLPADIKAKLKL